MNKDQQSDEERSTERRSTIEQEKLEHDVRHMFEHSITFNQFLGLEVQSLRTNEVRIGFSMRPELIGHFLHGRLHGGVISSVLDATGGLAVLWAITELHNTETADQTLQRFTHLGTVDLRVDYLRQGVGDDFAATAQVIRLGKRIAFVQMQLTNNDERLIATGSATYIVS